MAYIKSFKDQSWLLPPSLEDIIPNPDKPEPN